MEEIKKYKGSIPMAGGLYPASGGEYPLINTALIEKDSVSGQRLDKYLEEYPYPFIYVGTAANKEMLDSLLPETEDSDNRSFIAFNKGEQVYYARSPITKEWTVCSASISEIANSVEGASLIGIGDDVNEFIDISSVKAYINTGEENDEYQLIEKQDLMLDNTFSKEEKNKIKSALGIESGIRVSDTQPDGNNEMIDVWINTSEEEETVELVSKSDLQDSSYFTDSEKDFVRKAIGVIGLDNIVSTIGASEDKVMSQKAVSDIITDLPYTKLNKQIGKNLFNKNTVTERFYLSGSGELREHDNYVISDYIPVEPQTNYTLTFLHSGGAYNTFYDKYLNFISGISQAELIANNGTFTTPENCAYIRTSESINHYASQQIEKGSEKTAFEEYTDYVPMAEAKTDIAENKTAIAENKTAIAENKTAIAKEQKDSSKKLNKKVGKNLFDKNTIHSGYYLSGIDTLSVNTRYYVSDYIPVDENTEYVLNLSFGGSAYNHFYNGAKESIGSLNCTELQQNSNTFTTPDGCVYFRFTDMITNLERKQLELGAVSTKYEDYTEYVPLQDVGKEVEALKAQLSKTIKNPILTAAVETLNDGEYLNSLSNIDIKKNHTQTFFAKITNFSGIQIGHGETEFNGYYATIDNTNITVYKWNGSVVKEQAHGLTIADYIYVVINKYDALKVNIIITTSTGSYTLSSVSWGGDNGTIYTKSIGSTLTDCVLNWTSADLKHDIWVFGDSYLGLPDSARFPYYLLQYGYKNWLACGASGANCAKELDAFTKLLELGTPKYAVWCLGMNDPDKGAISEYYLTNTQAFIAKCEENGIIPVISTIPSCWGSTAEDSDITVTRDNSYKTAWVRASGYRYIDFADAVEQAGGGWYEGMLSTDGVHPTQLGAVTLANRFICDFPEICTTL